MENKASKTWLKNVIGYTKRVFWNTLLTSSFSVPIKNLITDKFVEICLMPTFHFHQNWLDWELFQTVLWVGDAAVFLLVYILSMCRIFATTIFRQTFRKIAVFASSKSMQQISSWFCSLCEISCLLKNRRYNFAQPKVRFRSCNFFFGNRLQENSALLTASMLLNFELCTR